MRILVALISIALFIFAGCNNQANDAAEKKYEKPADAGQTEDTLKIQKKSKPARPLVSTGTPQQKKAFGPVEESWLKENLDNARQLKNDYWKTPLPSMKEFLPQVLDKVFQEWKEDGSPQKKTADFVINALGAAFGKWLTDNYDMKWITVTDTSGTGYAVIHEKGSVIAYPSSSVKKAIEEEKEKPFSHIGLVIKQRIQDTESDTK